MELLADPGVLLAQLAEHMRAKQPLKPFETPHEGDELTCAARQKIDDDILEHERKIRSLRTRRNELSPISVLPPEILSRIFILARDLSIEVQFRNHYAKWMRVGHVCHHWREVALGCPTLWSIPVFTKPDLAREMIQRSRLAALTIRSTPSTWTSKMFEQLEHALAQTYRIQSIELALGSNNQTIKTMFSLLSQPAPLLENISLSGPTFSVGNNQISFPSEALSDAPRLRSVEFDRLSFSWESAIFKQRNLTELQLSNNYAAVYGASTVGQMMDALHNLPNLRILNLEGSIPSHTTSNGSEKTLEFKFLEQLSLSAPAVDCLFVLRRIQYPPRATIALHSTMTEIEDSAAIFSLIGQNLRRTQIVGVGIPHSPVSIQSARLMSPESGPLEVSLFDKLDDMSYPYSRFSCSNPIVRVRLDGGCVRIQTRGRLLLCIYNSLDLSSLRALLLGWSFTRNHIRAIRDSIGKLPKLKMITVSRSFPEICVAIAGVIKDPPPGKPGKTQTARRRKLQHSPPAVTIFPVLRTINVNGVDFRPRNQPEMMEQLTDMLMKRSDINAPIDRLCLEQCTGVRTWMKTRLGELVVDLEVDGEVIDVRELGPDDDWDDEDDYSDEDEDEYSDEDYLYPYYPHPALGWLPF